MINKKQDLNGVRTAEDVERKYKLGAISGLEEEISEFTVDSYLSSSSTHPVENKIITGALSSLNNNKVDKIAGKGLSTNDFTNDYKNASHTHTNKSLLDTITQQRVDAWDNNSIAGAFPINKVEVFFDNNDHSNFLGFTWERVGAGRIPVGIDVNDSDFNTIGKTGGEKTHTLTTNEIPSHQHSLNGYALKGWGSGVNATHWGVDMLGGSTSSNEGYINNDSAKTQNAGGGQAHNNMSPYIVMAFWKRIA